jgi:hypothetical protein
MADFSSLLLNTFPYKLYLNATLASLMIEHSDINVSLFIQYKQDNNEKHTLFMARAWFNLPILW